MDQLPRMGKRELICLLLFTCNYVASVRRGFLFLWVLGMGCSERFPLPLGAWDGLCYYIVALPEPSIYLFYQEIGGCLFAKFSLMQLSLFCSSWIYTRKKMSAKFCCPLICIRLEINTKICLDPKNTVVKRL